MYNNVISGNAFKTCEILSLILRPSLHPWRGPVEPRGIEQDFPGFQPFCASFKRSPGKIICRIGTGWVVIVSVSTTSSSSPQPGNTPTITLHQVSPVWPPLLVVSHLEVTSRISGRISSRNFSAIGSSGDFVTLGKKSASMLLPEVRCSLLVVFCSMECDPVAPLQYVRISRTLLGEQTVTVIFAHICTYLHIFAGSDNDF